MIRIPLFLIPLTLSACGFGQSQQAIGSLTNGLDGPAFTCEEQDLDIRVYESFVTIAHYVGSMDEQHWRYDTSPTAYAVQTDMPIFQCGSESEFIVIKVFSDRIQVGYRVDADSQNLEWLQYRMIVEGETVSPVPDDQSSDHAWQEMRRTDYSIFYKAGSESDRDEMNTHMAHAVASAKQEFSKHDTQAILDAIEAFDVYVHPAPTSVANDQLALLQFLDSLGQRSQLHFLAPSAHTKGVRPNLHSYIRKTVMHEYVTLFLVFLVHMQSGWNDLYSAPTWFMQGFQEYLSLLHGDDYSKNITRQSYIDQFKENKGRISISNQGIEVKDDYYDGAVLLHFFYTTYGQESVHRILTSPEASFSEALERELGSYSSIAKEFSVWSNAL